MYGGAAPEIACSLAVEKMADKVWENIYFIPFSTLQNYYKFNFHVIQNILLNSLSKNILHVCFHLAGIICDKL